MVVTSNGPPWLTLVIQSASSEQARLGAGIAQVATVAGWSSSSRMSMKTVKRGRRTSTADASIARSKRAWRHAAQRVDHAAAERCPG